MVAVRNGRSRGVDAVWSGRRDRWRELNKARCGKLMQYETHTSKCLVDVSQTTSLHTIRGVFGSKAVVFYLRAWALRHTR